MMPFFYNYECKQCLYRITAGEPGATYIIADSGERIECPHIGENSFIAEQLNICEEDVWDSRGLEWNSRSYKPRWWWVKSRRNRYNHLKVIRDLFTARTGKLTRCVCDKLHEFDIDYARDTRICPACGSNTIKRVIDLEGSPCPHCKSGHIEKLFTGTIT